MRSDDFFDAKRAGAEIIVGIRISRLRHRRQISGFLSPGTDGALYLSMISHIIDNKWYNEDYMRAHTLCRSSWIRLPANCYVAERRPRSILPPARPPIPPTISYGDTVTNVAVPYDAPGVSAALEGIYEVAAEGRSGVRAA